MASTLSRLYDFVAGNRIRSDEIDAEFDQLVGGHNSLVSDFNAIGTEIVDLDAATATLSSVKMDTIIANVTFATKTEVNTALDALILGEFPPNALEDAVDAAIAEMTFTQSTIGSDTFPLGETSYVVTNAFITLGTWVDVSPDLTNKQGTWTVVSANGYFTITSDATETSNIGFDWRATK